MEKQWSKVLDQIRGQVNAANFRTWFAQTSVESLEGDNLVINVPHSFIKEQLSTKQLPVIQSAVGNIFGEDTHIEFQVNPTKTPALKEELELGFSLPTKTSTSNLNPKYTLENFVVGMSNNLAYTAAQAVVANPGVSYNPLFVYGGTGVGKTHLMLGVGNALIKKQSQLKVIYCPLEKFMNDFVQGIQTKRMGEFRARYRNCDLFLIDDVQFFSGRDAVQEEFFHTFNELQAKNSQVILTSDRPPHEIQKLEPRLASRFQGGLMVDIQIPDFDTRVAILKAKCSERGEPVAEEILTKIAEGMPTNARELEGKLIQIIQTAKLTGQTLTEETVSKYLGTPQHTIQKIDHKKVFSEVNRYFNVKMGDLTGPRRKKELVLPRQLAMYLMYEECKITYERIGELLGGRDHTTILHGVDKIRGAITRDREIQKMLIEIKQSLIL